MSEGFVAYVYEDDYRQIQELVQQYPDIETGGDLFGLWKDESTVVIQQFIGPGKNCQRTPSSFHQDIDYLQRVGSLITTEEGLCNVGEWHSHHQIGMPEPSAADRRTVFSNMPQLGLERFVLFIATIDSKGSRGKRTRDVKVDDINLRPFLFKRSEEAVVKGDRIKIIPGQNPHRLHTKARQAIEGGAEKKVDGKKPPKPKPGEKKNGENKKGIQGKGNENQSPNLGSAAPKDQKNASPQSNTAQPHGPGTQGTSVWQVWDDSLHSGTAQGHGHGIQKTDGSGKVTIGKMCAKGLF